MNRTLEMLLNDPSVMIETFMLNGRYTITGNDYTLLSMALAISMEAHKEAGDVAPAKIISRISYHLFKTIRHASKNDRIIHDQFDIRLNPDDLLIVAQCLIDLKHALEMAVNDGDEDDAANGKAMLADMNGLLNLFEPAMNLANRITSMIQ